MVVLLYSDKFGKEYYAIVRPQNNMLVIPDRFIP